MLTTEIQNLFHIIDSESVIIMSVGNSLRSDDGIGPYILSKIKNHQSKSNKIELIDAGIVPENYIQKVLDLKPDKIIIIDAADFGGHPGELRFIPNNAIPESSVSTHAISLRLLAELINKYSGAEVIFLGIQPKNIEFGEELSAKVKEQADSLIKEICTKYML